MKMRVYGSLIAAVAAAGLLAVAVGRAATSPSPSGSLVPNGYQPPTVGTGVIGEVSFVGASGATIPGGSGSQSEFPIVGYTDSSSTSVGGAGAGASLVGRRQHQPIAITKPIDAASPVLLGVCASGQVLRSVVIDLYAAGGTTPQTEIKLATVQCVGLAHTNEVETVELTYRTLTWTWLPQNVTATDNWLA